MSKVRVWTRQSERVLQEIETTGRYIVKKEYIQEKMEDHSELYFNTYHWYTQKAKEIVPKPDDVIFPIWVSLTEGSKLGLTPENVFFELEVEFSDLIIINEEKWGHIVNYMYIPKDEDDDKAHEALLSQYKTHDTAAYLSPFYPVIKSKIVKSWERIFEDEPKMSNDMIGTLWEIRREWIKDITLGS